MTAWFLLAAYVAAVNPPRIRPGLSRVGDRGEPRPLLFGALMAAGVGLLLVLGASTILDALDITDETWRLGAGVVAGLAGARVLIAPRLGELPTAKGMGLLPVSFPLLLTPPLVVLAILSGATEPFPAAWGLLVAGVAAGVAAGKLRMRTPGLWLALARLLGAVLVVLGIALVVAGIRDV